MVDRSAIGRSFSPVHASVEPGRLRYFFNTLGERNPIYRDAEAAKAAGYAAIPIPPTYLFCLEMMDAEKPFEFLEALQIDLARVLHGEQRFSYHAPVVVGDRLDFSVASQRRRGQEGRSADDRERGNRSHKPARPQSSGSGALHRYPKLGTS
jgi:acyl dehydratase